jgi:hypothetical protein
MCEKVLLGPEYYSTRRRIVIPVLEGEDIWKCEIRLGYSRLNMHVLNTT